MYIFARTNVYILFFYVHLGKTKVQVLEDVIQTLKIDFHENEATRPCDVPSSSSLVVSAYRNTFNRIQIQQH